MNHKQQIGEYKDLLLSPNLSAEQLEAVMAALLTTTSPEALSLLAEAVSEPYNPEVQAATYQRLQAFDFDRPVPIAAVCAVWQRNRNSKLKTLLQQKNWKANQPTDLKILTHLLNNQLTGLDDGGLDFVQTLVPILRDSDPAIAYQADQLARQIKEPNRQALLYFLSGQWQRYEDLDFDQHLMRRNYQAGSEKLRRTILEVARTAGRADFARIITTSRNSQDVSRMSPAEFDSLLELLAKSERWDELWNLVHNSSINYSLKIMQKLAKTNWQPAASHQQNYFNSLKQLANQLKPNFIPADKFIQPTPQPFLEDDARHIYNSDASVSYDSKFCVYQVGKSINFCDLTTFSISTFLNREDLLAYSVSPVEPLVAYILDHNLTLYDYEKFKVIWLVELPFIEQYPHFTLNLDKTFISLIASNGITVFSRADGSIVTQLPRLTNKGGYISFLSITFSPNGKFLAACTYSGSVIIYRTENWQIINEVKINTTSRYIKDLSFASDSHTLSCYGRGSGEIDLFSVTEQQVTRRLNSSGRVNGLTFSRYGQLLLNAASTEENVCIIGLWQLSNWYSQSLKLPSILTYWWEVRIIGSPDERKMVIDNGRTMLLCDTRWLRLWEFPLELLTVQDLDYIGQAMTDTQLTEAERTWLLFAKAILEWRMQHDIEIHEATESVPSQWDIEIEG